PAGEIPEEVRDIHLLAYGRVPTAGAPLLQQCVQRPPELRDQILWRNAGGRSAPPDRFHATLSVMQIQEVASLELGDLNAMKDHCLRCPPDLESTCQESTVKIHLFAPRVVRAFAAECWVEGTHA